jgi:transcriptional regulator with XRE-family HTH domain
MHIGEFLQRFRDAKKLSRKKMAAQIGVSEFRLQKWEDKKFSPKSDDNEKIRSYFNLISIQYLSEDILAKCIAAEDGQLNNKVSFETILQQKDLLLQEKDKRIEELQKLVMAQEEVIDRYKTGKVLHNGQ